MQLSDCSPTEQTELAALTLRIGATHLRQRLGLEAERVPAPKLSHRLIRAGLTLGGLRAGQPVNLEIDLIARYVERMLTAPKPG